MPINGIPVILENTLDSLLQHNTLTSWTIKGGPKFSQVFMRFTGAEMATADVQYRRTAPSRRRRDRQRAVERQGVREIFHPVNSETQTELNDIVTNMETNVQNQHVSSMDDDRSYTVTPPQDSRQQPSVTDFEIAPDHMTSNTATGVDNNDLGITRESSISLTGVGDTSGDLPEQYDVHTSSCSVVTVDDMVGSQGCDVNNGECLDTYNRKLDEIIVRLERFDPESLILDNSNVDMKEADDEESEESDGAVVCDGCGCMMHDTAGCSWYTCSECVDVNMCWLCFKKDIHGHHNKHLCKFTCPSDWNATHCDCCGLVLKEDGELYQCQSCQDYCLCTDCCLKKFMHTKHIKYLQFCSVRVYNSDVK